MRNRLLPICATLLTSETALAHAAPFTHMDIADSNLHLLTHLLMTLLASVGVFFASHWLIARITQARPPHTQISR